MSRCGNFLETGTSTCANLLRIADRLIFVPTLGSDGTKNTIATAAGVTKAALKAMIEEIEELDMIYVLPRMDNVEDTRGDVEYFEWESGKKTRIRQGVRTFIGAIEGNDTSLLGRLQSFEDMEFGYWEIDKDGNFVYSLDSEGVIVNPIAIKGSSFSVKLVKSTYSDAPMIMVQFDINDSENDKDIRLIQLSELDFDGRTSDLYGLDPSAMTEVSVPSTTAYVLTLATDYGVAIEGGIVGDFTAYNVTQLASVTLSGVTEDAVTGGKYTLAYGSGVSASDVLQITYKKTTYAQSLLISSATV